MIKSGISLCIIAKDEEKMIGNCLNSAKALVDEIILIDTGSKDKTNEIAKEYGAKIYKCELEKDFSKVRNESIKYATKEWILILDCDEELALKNRDEIKKIILNNKDVKGYNVLVGSYLDGQRRNSERDVRLFKNENKIKFNGRIREKVRESIVLNYGKNSIEDINIEIVHFGSDNKKVNIEEKFNRNMSILKEYTREERDYIYYYNLGNEYGRYGDFKKALNSYEKIEIDNLKDDDEIYRKIVLNKSKALFKEERHKECIEFIENHLKRLKEFRDLYFLKALSHIKIGDFKNAVKFLDEYRKREVDLSYPSSEFESVLNINEFYDEICNISKLLG